MGKKITMFSAESSSIQERFEQYLSAASAKGLSSKLSKHIVNTFTASQNILISQFRSRLFLARRWTKQSYL